MARLTPQPVRSKPHRRKTPGRTFHFRLLSEAEGQNIWIPGMGEGSGKEHTWGWVWVPEAGKGVGLMSG